MYDDLIKRLQEDKPSRRMMLTAADAIEELSLSADSYKRSTEEWAEEAYRAYSKYAKVSLVRQRRNEHEL